MFNEFSYKLEYVKTRAQRNMDDLKLTDTEHRYFSDLLLCCDNENTGKVTFYKANELFQSSNVPLDVLNKVRNLKFIKYLNSITYVLISSPHCNPKTVIICILVARNSLYQKNIHQHVMLE